MSSFRRVVITGLGLVSPIGLGVAAFRESLAACKSGVHTLQLFDAATLAVRFGGEIEEFDPLLFLDRKERKQLKFMVRTIQLGVAACRLARQDAGITSGQLDPERIGIAMGTGIVPGELIDLGPAGNSCLIDTGIDLERWGREGLHLIPPMWMLNHVPNMPASRSAILDDMRGPNNTITQHDAAALLALGEAFRIVQHDRADVMLGGGSDTRTATVNLLRNIKFTTLSQRNDAPERACQPFGIHRDGHVLGEGAGLVVLEARDHAVRRGARILGEVVGFGSAFDVKRDGTGIVRAVRAALNEAGITPADLDHVNAHAGGAPLDDPREARGISAALERHIPVVAMKSWMGNCGNGASVLELAPSILALNGDLLPPTLNHEGTAPDCPVFVSREPRPVVKPFALKVALTDRGQCAAVVIRRED